MDKTEKLSFLNPEATYSESDVPDTIVDLEVRNGLLVAHKASDAEEDVGSWFGRSGVQIKTMEITPNDQIMTVLTDDRPVITPRLKWDVTVPSRLAGVGQLQAPTQFPYLFNDTPTDFFDADSDLLYMLALEPKYTSLTGTSMVTTTGVSVVASSQWSSSYPIYRIFNRKVEFVSDGLLGSGNLTVTFTFPVDKPAEIKGYLYQNLRADYVTNSYIIEYLPPGGQTWLPLDTVSPGMALNTIIYPKPVVVSAIRWRALTFGSAAGIGRLDWLVGRSGKTATATPVVFPSTHFNLTEDADKTYIEPNRLNAQVSDFPRFDLNKYHHLLFTPNVGQRGLFKAGVMNVVPWNVVKADAKVIANELPLIKLKKGRWYYRYALALVNSGKFRVYLSIGGSLYPLSDLMSGISQFNGARAVVVQDEGYIEIREETNTFMVIEQDGPGGLTAVATDSHSASLELWWIDEVFTPVVAPILPQPGLVPAPFKHLEGTFPVGNGSALFTASLADTTWWSNATNYLVISVGTHFRIWRCSIAGGSSAIAQLKITKLDTGAYPLAGAHRPLTKSGSNQWELMTYTLPPGVYRFDFVTDRKDSAWFIEQMAKPAQWEFGDVNIRITLPMTSGNESGQIVTSSSALSGSYSGFNAFTAIPTGGGWISGAATDFSEYLKRINVPMTTATSDGQIATASSQYGAAYSPVYAFKDVATTEGWVSANSQATVANPHWLAIQLAAPKAINEYRITNRNTGVNTVIPPKSWQLQYSNDGSVWTTAHTVLNDPGNGLAQVRPFKIGSTITAKHWRLLITDSWPGVSTGSFVGVALFELLERKVATPEWLQVDFTTTQTFNNYAIVNRLYEDSNATHSPQDWKLQCKLTGGEWVTVHEVSGDTRNTYGLVREFTLPESVAADAVRLAITKKNPGTGVEADNTYTCVQHFKLSRTENTLNSDWL